jgi:hypothetical protein
MKTIVFNLPLFMVACLVLSSCSTERYVESPSNSEPEGPGLFTGEKGSFSVNDAFDETKQKLKSGGYYILDLDGSPRMSEEEFKEFESFRAWLSSREQGTEEYKEYEAWRAFQQYRDHQSVKGDEAQ